MRPILFVAFSIFVICQNSIGQIVCLSGKQFVYPELALRAEVSSSFLVRLDVIDLSPRNIKIDTLVGTPSKLLELFRASIAENLRRFIFLSDTNGLELKLRYSVAKHRQVSTSFAECVSDNEIRFVGEQPLVTTYIDAGYIPENPDIDTLYLDGTVPYKRGRVRPSNILVRRVFNDDGDSTVIIRNSHPELLEEILSAAALYKKTSFTNRAPKGTHFFIKFRVLREMPGCGIKDSF